MCHMSHVLCHFFFVLTKSWIHLVEGMLSTGPTPSNCEKDTLDNCSSSHGQVFLLGGLNVLMADKYLVQIKINKIRRGGGFAN